MEEAFKKPDFPIAPKKPIEADVKTKEQEVPYTEPSWSEKPNLEYGFEVLKNGVIVEEIKNLQNRAFWMFGRLLTSDITSLHPTTSRYHAVLQYRPAGAPDTGEHGSEQKVEPGWFIYDLDSTHGTFLNKMRIRPRTYVRIRVGHQLKFGSSTRSYILTGPTNDEEEESELTVTQLKQQKCEREMELMQKEVEQKAEVERREKQKEAEGISWGMGDDAEEEPDLFENPYAQTNNEELFLDDPKKTLRGFFEREGHELEYKCDELSPGTFVCKVQLPIDDEFGKSITCEVQHKGKKKECVAQCALEACRILDRHGVLRQANHEPRRSKKANSDDDSDDDNFFDRTGDVEKKRLRKLGQTQSEAMTYEQLIAQETEILDKICQQELKLNELLDAEKRQKTQSENDDLDSFMSSLSNMNQKFDKFQIRSLKMEIQNAKANHIKLQKLINIAKPQTFLPPITSASTINKLPLFGKRNKLGSVFGNVKTAAIEPTVKVPKPEVEFQPENDEEDLPLTEAVDLTVKTIAIEKSMPVELELSSEKPAESLIDIAEAENSKRKSVDELSEQNSKPSPPKKRKNRIRIRDRYREGVDIADDDEYIDEEKISTWVAPEGQSGDGITALNAKFGY